MTLPRLEGLTPGPTLRRLLPALLIPAMVLIVAACLPGSGGGSPGAPTPTATPHPPLTPV